MWTHLCELYKSLVAVETGCPCNWCDAKEFTCEELLDDPKDGPTEEPKA